jgi:hypothetical protein
MEFEKKGVLSVTICTSGFASLIKATAQSKGFPHLAILAVPHPIAGIPADEVRKKADDAFEDMVSIFITPSEKPPEKSESIEGRRV